MEVKKQFYRFAVMTALCAGVLTACSGGTETTDEVGVSIASDNLVSMEMSEETNDNEDGGDHYDPMLTGTYEDGSSPEFSGKRLLLTVNGGEEVVIALYSNTAADALLARLPLENLSFFDLSGVEKPIERLEDPLSLGEEEPGYDPVAGEMVIYRPWANFTIFYGDFRYSDELVPLGKVESGLEVLSSKTEDFTGTLELMETE